MVFNKFSPFLYNKKKKKSYHMNFAVTGVAVGELYVWLHKCVEFWLHVWMDFLRSHLCATRARACQPSARKRVLSSTEGLRGTGPERRQVLLLYVRRHLKTLESQSASQDTHSERPRTGAERTQSSPPAHPRGERGRATSCPVQ